jgi:hypothetical protein
MHSTVVAHLGSSVRELATDNIKCAVMLTGVMLLQVRALESRHGEGKES